ncbi:MAG: GAF domain-containing protein [Waterburya sp.]
MTDSGLKKVFDHLCQNLAKDRLVQTTTHNLRHRLNVDRLVIYYFYRQWEGRVTYESISSPEFSIFGSTGPDECFNREYAAMYQAGRISAIANIQTAPIAECHRDFLQDLKVKANLVVPILSSQDLWGLLVAHHCQAPRNWSQADIQAMLEVANTLAQSSVIAKTVI